LGELGYFWLLRFKTVKEDFYKRQAQVLVYQPNWQIFSRAGFKEAKVFAVGKSYAIIKGLQPLPERVF
jgi:hypothetical protein